MVAVGSESVTATRIVLLVEYDGTRYSGFQRQPRLLTVQGEIERALYQLTQEKIKISAAGRTDAGVHALGQVVGFKTESSLPSEVFVKGLNHYLPEDIAIRAADRAENGLDVRRQAISREYRYSIINRPTPTPLNRYYAYHVAERLDEGAMAKACATLIGRHDFSAFVSSLGGNPKNTVRTVYAADLKREGEAITFDITANSYLPHQVRNIVGALVQVGKGRMEVEQFEQMVTLGKCTTGPATAPARGLCLIRVNYPEGDSLWEER